MSSSSVKSESAFVSFPWSNLPCEIKCEIINLLRFRDIRRLATTNHLTYDVCIPRIFQTVKLRSRNEFDSFVASVPRSRLAFVREIEICTKPSNYSDVDPSIYEYTPPSPITDPLVNLLKEMPGLRSLAICTYGSLEKSVIPVLANLSDLKRLSISNWADECVAPLSERLVVAMAFAIPSLEELLLTRITRSQLHAPDLKYDCHIPTVNCDDDTPSPNGLQDKLNLPSLLRLSHLRRLSIKETHLGDPMWSSESRANSEDGNTSWQVCCPLEVLEIGAYHLELPEINEECTKRILRNVESTVSSFSLSTPLTPPDAMNQIMPIAPDFRTLSRLDLAHPHSNQLHHRQSDSSTSSTVLPRLRSLQLTPLVPVTDLVTTLSQPQLSQSPVHTIACTFHPDDAAQGYTALAAFLGTHIMRDLSNSSSGSQNAPTLYRQLKRIQVRMDTSDPSDEDMDTTNVCSPSMYTPGSAAARKLDHDRREAARRLRALCAALGLEAIIDGAEDVCLIPQVTTGGIAPGSIKGSRGRSKTA